MSTNELPIRIILKIPGKRPPGYITPQHFWNEKTDTELWRLVSAYPPDKTDWETIAGQLGTTVENCAQRASELYLQRLTLLQEARAKNFDSSKNSFQKSSQSQIASQPVPVRLHNEERDQFYLHSPELNSGPSTPKRLAFGYKEDESSISISDESLSMSGIMAAAVSYLDKEDSEEP